MTPVIWPSVVIAIAILLVMGTILVRRLPDGLQLRLLLVELFTLLIAAGDTAFELTSRPDWSTFWLSTIYTGVIGLAASWWLLVVQLARVRAPEVTLVRGGLERPVVAAAIALWLLMATNPLHGHYVTLQVNSRSLYHWGFWAQTGYSYAITLATLGILHAMARRAVGRRARTQFRILIAAPVSVVAGNLVYVFWPTALPIDPTVIAVGVSGVLFAAGMYWTQLFDPAPGVLQEVLRRSRDGALILGRGNRLEWANTAGARLLGGKFGTPPLEPGADGAALLAGVLGRLPGGGTLSLERLREILSAEAPPECVVESRSGEQCLRLKVETVRSHRGRFLVRYVLLADATLQVEAERVLRRSGEELETLVAKRTRALSRANEEKDQALDALARSEARYRALVADAPLGVIACGRDGSVLAANHHLWTILAVDAPAGVQDLDALTHPPLVRAGIAGVLRRATRSGRHAREDTQYAAADGRTLHLRIHAAPLIDRDRKVQAAQAIVEDVTDQVCEGRAVVRDRDELARVVREQSEALEVSRDRLTKTERLSGVGTLVAGVAHQINNPLGAILAGAELALSYEDEPDRIAIWREVLADNAVQAIRCGEIVRSLLQLSRSESVSMSVEDLNEVVRRAVFANSTYAIERGASVVLALGDAPLPVKMSSIQIEQVVVNVHRNAVESGGDGVGIRVTTEARGDRVVVRIEDDGHGIAPDALDRIFDPLFTTREGVGGSGIGLSVAHGLVVSHGGEMRVESAPGRGTRVEIELPLAGRVASP